MTRTFIQRKRSTVIRVIDRLAGGKAKPGFERRLLRATQRRAWGPTGGW